MAELLKRTELNYDILEKIDPDRPKLDKQEKEEVEIQIKYEGYIKMQAKYSEFRTSCTQGITGKESSLAGTKSV